MRMLTIFFILIVQQTAFAQTGIVGKWKTIDDETGAPKSIVDIFEKNGKYFGRVVKLFRKPNEDQDPVCKECDSEDPRFNKKIIGMEILKDMEKEKEDDEYEDGSILDPNNGKVYRCKIWIDGQDLKLRGYLGPFYRTQTWKKAE